MLFREGSASIGVGIGSLLGPTLFSILAAGGADYGLIDMEHTSFSYRDVAALIASARAAQLPVIVRPPEVSRSAIGRVLDIGADGVLLPRSESPDDAAAAVRYAKYRPLGDRGDDGRIAALSRLTDPRPWIDAVNRNTVLIGSVETPADIEHIDAICSTAGIDGIWVGPADLALSLGVPHDPTAAVYRAAVDRIVEACRARGMPFAIGTAATPAAALEQIRFGCFTVMVDDEVGLLTRAIAGYASAVRDGVDAAPADRDASG
jgi:2-keto-3-deoxy-L-rhamnonate aldolase RhmA